MFNITRSLLAGQKSFIRGGVLVVLMLLSVVGVDVFLSSKALSSTQPGLDGRIPGGSLVIAGGGYVTPGIRQRFLELAGGENARIVVIPATDPALGTEESWLAPWRKIGATHVEFCHASNRAVADTAEFCSRLRHATGVWFSGGDQAFLAERYVDTAVQDALHDVLRRNGVVGGCSAGAAILSRVMIQDGEDQPIQARGFDLISDAIVDQHFLQRNRLWRMQLMLESHPTLIGLGIDEDTALIYEVRTARLSVLGESYAMVCLPPSGGHYARTEVLHPGDDISLMQLRQKHLAYQPPPKVGSPQPAMHST